MPDQCNALVRVNLDADYSKINCKWSNESSGRKKIKETAEVIKKNKLKNPKYIGLVLEKDHLEFIQRQARQKSVQEDRLIQPNELIRQALQIAFPSPKQFDMFGERK